MDLVFVHGPAACGKLTVAREIARVTGFRLFHNHLTVDLATALFDFGSPGFVALREAIWLTALQEAARREQSLVFTFQPEATVRPGFPQEVFESVEREGGRVHFVALHCPEALIEQRVEEASRSAFGKLRSVEQYRRLRDGGAFDFPPMPEPALRLDTGETSPEENARRVAAHLAAGQ